MHLSIPPHSWRPVGPEVHEALSRLRSEIEAAEEGLTKALLLHEVGTLEELAHNDHNAAKDLLGAINADTTLHEPLEQLAFLLERRGSYKNLPRLLERMARVASNDEERERAQLALGDFLLDVGGDLESARKAYDAALELRPDNLITHLARQWLAGEQNDLELLRRSLEARAQAAQEPAYRAALRLVLARVQIQAGQAREAGETLESVAREQNPFRLAALSALEQLARLCTEPKLASDAALRRAQLLDEASEDVAVREALALRDADCSLSCRGDAWLQVGLSYLSAGHPGPAMEALGSARKHLPDDEALLSLLLEIGVRHGDESVAELVREELPKATDPKTTALLALIDAWHRAKRGDTDAALEMLRRVIDREPRSVVARALEMNWRLASERLERESAELLEAVAEQLPEGKHRAGYEMMAAAIWSEASDDPRKAKAALVQASGAMAPAAVARTARLLAATRKDQAWLQDATQRLLKNASRAERVGLLLELTRSSWLSGDETAAWFNLEEASGSEEGAWVAAALTAYGTAPGRDSKDRGERSLRALERLSALESDPERRFARAHLVATLRQSSDRPEGGLAALERLHEERPQNLAVALQLAEAYRSQQHYTGAAASLLTAADALAPSALTTPLRIASALLHWMEGKREIAVAALKRTEQEQPGSSTQLLAWAVRSAHPDDPDERRLALEANERSGTDPQVNMLERFALECGSMAKRTEATEALDRLEPDLSSDTGQAVNLARALWPASRGYRQALDTLAASGTSGREIALALEFLTERRAEQPSQTALEQLSRQWAEVGSLPGALEWFAATLCNGNTEDEIKARRSIAAQLGGTASAAVAASASLVEYIATHTVPDALAPGVAVSELANLEVAPPGCDPRRRAHALLHAQDQLGDNGSLIAWIASGYNALAAGQPKKALSCFHSAVLLSAEDLSTWEGIRAAARALENPRLEAGALGQLAELTSDPMTSARLLRDQVKIFDALGEEEASQHALDRCVELDVTDFESFDRLFRLRRAEKRYHDVIELAGRRLDVTNHPKEMAKLCWERARAQRALGNIDAAMADLETVTVLDSEHPGPPALAGEIYISQGNLEEAARQLKTLSHMKHAPAEQRLMSGVAAADLYENELNDVHSATELLLQLHDEGLTTLAVRERLARTAAKAEKWEEAVRLLEGLMEERAEASGRIEAARLALAICRDQLETPARALLACAKLLAEAPADAEALDFILDTELSAGPARSLLETARTELLANLDPADDAMIARLGRIAEHLGEGELRHICLGVLITLDGNSHPRRVELDELAQRASAVPVHPITEALLEQVFRGVLDTPLGRIAATIDPFVPQVLGRTPKALGLGRRDRIRSGSESQVAQELESWLRSVQATDYELYAGAPDPDALLVIPGPKSIALVLGAKVTAPLSPWHRQAFVAELLATQAGLHLATHGEPEDVAALLVAACSLADITLPVQYPSAVEWQKRLHKELPRKVRKALTPFAEAALAAEQDPKEWAIDAGSAVDRASALATGDISYTLWTPRLREVNREIASEQRARAERLIRFVLSPDFLELRRAVGMSVQ